MDLTDILTWGWGLIVPYTIYLHRKIDDIAEDRVDRKEFNGVISSLREEIHSGNRDITTRLDTLLTTLLQQRNQPGK